MSLHSPGMQRQPLCMWSHWESDSGEWMAQKVERTVVIEREGPTLRSRKKHVSMGWPTAALHNIGAVGALSNA